MVAYDPMLGGWAKRTLDLLLTLVTFPIWSIAILVLAATSKTRHPAPVFLSDERIGYGGRSFRCFRLRVRPPSAVIERLRPPAPGEPANDWGSIAQQAEDRREKWAKVFERLPQLFNVIAGDMSLVGPRPLLREQLDALKGGKKHYLSARPGVVSASAEEETDEAIQYKLYSMSWSLMLDLSIVQGALNGLANRGELWKPGRVAKGKAKPATRVRARAPSAPVAEAHGE